MQVVPYNDAFEKAVIVSVLQNPLLLPQLQLILEPADFFNDKNKQIYAAINSINPENLDSLAVHDKLQPNVQSYFQDLVADSDNILPSASNVLFYAESIKGKSKLRKGIQVGVQITDICYQNQDDPEEALHRLEDVFAAFLRNRLNENHYESTAQSFSAFLESLKHRTPNDENHIRTGFYQLDLMIQRLEGLVVLAGKSGLGKTSFAVNLLTNILRSGHSAIMFSLEQPKEQIFERFLSIESGIPNQELRLGLTVPDERTISKINPLLEKFHLDDKSGIPTSYIASVARQKELEWGKVGVIAVDYLNLVRLNGKPTVEALGDVCKELRTLGKELGCPVILLAQLRRNETGENKKRRPELYDLRSSGEIEQVADQVLMLYRESYFDLPGSEPDEDIVEVLVRKNRNGNQGIVELKWVKALTKFEDL